MKHINLLLVIAMQLPVGILLSQSFISENKAWFEDMSYGSLDLSNLPVGAYLVQFASAHRIYTS